MKKVLHAIKQYFKTMPRHMKILLTAIVLLCLVTATANTVIGKYVFDKEVNGTFVANAKLADTFKLLEHQAVQGTDGSYTLNNGSVVNANTYQLIPGLTIPKDPYVAITGKTAIGAYLYLEVIEDSLSAQLTYAIDTTKWTLLSGVVGPHGGAVYTYAAGLIDNQSTGLDHIAILSGNSFTLTKTPITGSAEALKFCGYLIQPASGEATALAAFTGKFSAVTP